MKKIFSILLLALTSMSCEEVIDIDLPSAPPRFVINAALERIYDTDNITFTDQALVKLSFSTPFFSTEPNFVNDAQVSITNMTNNTVYEIINDGSETGTYTNNDNLVIEPEVVYKLTVIYNGNIYQSTNAFNLSIPIDNAIQVKNNSSFNKTDFAITLTYTDIPNADNSYILDFGFGNITSIKHENFFTDGAETTITQFFEKIEDNLLKIKVSGADTRFANYVNSAVSLANGSSAGPFGTVPFRLKGNIINITDSDNFPFGYFHVNEVYNKCLTLVPNESL